MLLEEYKDTTIIDCVLPNEPHYLGTIRCDLHWSQIHEMLKGSEGFISIDSCLNHFLSISRKAWSSHLGFNKMDTVWLLS